MKDFALTLGLAAVTVAPFALLAGVAVGGMYLVQKMKEKKGVKVAGDFGDEGEWDFLDDTELDYWDAYA